MSHPARVCGLKPDMPVLHAPSCLVVTPRAGVRIETGKKSKKQSIIIMSHPARVCGLKLHRINRFLCRREVTPRAGVRIETAVSSLLGNWSMRHTPRGCAD